MGDWDNIRCTERIDGFVVTSKDWNLIGGMFNLELKAGFIVRTTNSTELKGIKELETGKGVLAFLGDTNSDPNFTKAVLITSQKRVAGKEDVEDLDIARIRDAYVKSVDPSVSKLPETAGSQQNLRQYEHDFRKRFEQRCACCARTPYIIHRDDVATFGKTFQEKMKEELHGLNYKVCLVVWRFGQHAIASNFWRILMILNLGVAKTIVVHMARDFEEDNKFLLWKKKAIEKYRHVEDCRGEKQWFRNFFVDGHAHLESQFRPSPKSKQAQDNHPSPSSPRGEVGIVSLKFYTSPFKELHRGHEKDAKFRRPKVQEALTVFPNAEKHAKDRFQSIEEIISNIQILKNGRAKCTKEARFEAILCLTNDNLTTEDIRRKFDRYFSAHMGAGMKKHLSRFESADFLEQIDSTIMVAADTLEPILREAKRRRDENMLLLAVPNIHDLQLALACEAIISFGVYGKLNQFSGGIRFPEIWKDELRMNEKYYKDNGAPFRGLARCANAKVENGRVVYTGRLTVSGRIWQNLEWDIWASKEESSSLATRITEDIAYIHEASLEGREADRDEILNRIEKISRVMTLALVGYATRKSIGMKVVIDPVTGTKQKIIEQHEPAIWLRKAELVESSKLLCESSKDLVMRLFEEPSNFVQLGLAHVARALGETVDGKPPLLSRSQLVKLKHAVAKQLNEWILKSKGLCILYPVEDDRALVSLVLPYYGTATDNYCMSSDESFYRNDIYKKQSMLQSVYNFPFKMTFGIDVKDAAVFTSVLNNCFRQAYKETEKAGGVLRLVYKIRNEECLEILRMKLRGRN